VREVDVDGPVADDVVGLHRADVVAELRREVEVIENHIALEGDIEHPLSGQAGARTAIGEVEPNR
jgi:hypothetical protein